jgi:hypothetical protein
MMPFYAQIIYISLVSTLEAMSDGEAEEQCAVEAQEEELHIRAHGRE